MSSLVLKEKKEIEKKKDRWDRFLSPAGSVKDRTSRDVSERAETYFILPFTLDRPPADGVHGVDRSGAVSDRTICFKPKKRFLKHNEH
ncbi:hypothetical protein BgiBS90_017309 [Biomphalaria glabrata]|nr:hypothetical protein BgiBS90_017309 [Biomphalaria glabrata]